jgi:hypothetical protein
VCAPEGVTGKAKVHRRFVAREGVGVSVKAVEGETCAIAHTNVGSAKDGFGKYTALQPPVRTCVLPWNLVDLEVAGGLGISGKKANEVEEIVVNAAGGTFTIKHGGEETGPLASTASPGEVQSALEGSRHRPGNVLVPAVWRGRRGARRTRSCSSAASAKAITPLTTDRTGLVAGGVKPRR